MRLELTQKGQVCCSALLGISSSAGVPSRPEQTDVGFLGLEGRMGLLCALSEHMAVKGNSVTARALELC